MASIAAKLSGSHRTDNIVDVQEPMFEMFVKAARRACGQQSLGDVDEQRSSTYMDCISTP